MTIFTNGCFDILHSGHIHTLEAARKMGDRLIVGVNSDKSVRNIKGSGRPILPLVERIKVLHALRCVDVAVPFNEDTPQKLIESIRPETIVKGSDWRWKEVAGSNVSKVEYIDTVPGFSTTEIIRKIIFLYKSGVIDENGKSI